MTRVLLLALDVDLEVSRGEAIHTSALAQALAASGSYVQLVVGNALPIRRIPDVDVTVQASMGNVRTVSRLARLAKVFQPDVIYERRFSPKIGTSLASLLSVPLVVEINGIPMEEARMQERDPSGGVTAQAKAAVRNQLLRRASAVIAVTQGLKEALVSRFGLDGNRVFVVPNGVDTAEFFPQEQEEARRRLSFTQSPWTGFVGNLVRWQGLDTLISAATLLPPKHRIVLVGSGPDRERVEQDVGNRGIGPRFRFAGEVAHSAVPQYIAAMDVCVAPFTRERNRVLGVSALKIYEYLACARPVVVSDIPGATELVRQFHAGLVVPPDSPGALAEALASAAADRSLREGAERAAEHVAKSHSWNVVGRSVAGIIERVVHR